MISYLTNRCEYTMKKNEEINRGKKERKMIEKEKRTQQKADETTSPNMPLVRIVLEATECLMCMTVE